MQNNQHPNGPPPDLMTVEDEIIQVEVEGHGFAEVVTLELVAQADLLGHIRTRLELTEDIHLFERDKDEPLAEIARGRRAIHLVAHKHRQITVKVHFEHRTEATVVPPSKTVFKVLQWAVSKKAFNLDPLQAAKANLILPGAETPLPRESAIGSFLPEGTCDLIVDLTLKDFTNG